MNKHKKIVYITQLYNDNIYIYGYDRELNQDAQSTNQKPKKSDNLTLLVKVSLVGGFLRVVPNSFKGIRCQIEMENTECRILPHLNLI